MVATFRGVDWGGQAGPFKRVNVRSHPSAPARWEWGDRCRHSVKRSGRTVQLTAVRETSRNDGRWRCWDGGLQTPENSSFGYFTDLIFILQILFYRFSFNFTDFIFILQILLYFTDFIFYFTDFILLVSNFLFYRFHCFFYRFYFLFYRLIFYFTDFIFYFTDFILPIYFLFYGFYFYFTDFIFILQILFLFYRFYFAVFILHILFFILLYRFYFLIYRFYFTDFFIFYFFILKIITDIELYCSEYSATTTKSGKNHSRIFQF